VEGDSVAADAQVLIANAGGRLLEWDGSAQKVTARQDNAAAAAAALGEVAAATNLSTTVADCWMVLST
jgi:hypothetical protein